MASKRTPKQPASVHQLKVTLLGLAPSIWRRIAVPSDFTLGDLHHVIQFAMGWEHSHLHDFRIGKVTYGDPDMLVEEDDQDEWQAPLAQVVPRAGRKFRYLYDFGDSWEHEIQVESVGPPVRKRATRSCSRVSGPVHPRIAAASGAMPTCWRSWTTLTIRTTRSGWNGWGDQSTQRRSI